MWLRRAMYYMCSPSFSSCNLLPSLVHFHLYLCESFCCYCFTSAETPEPTRHACTVTLLPTWSRTHGPFPLSPSAVVPTQTNSSTRNCLGCRLTVFSCGNASSLDGWSTPYSYWTTPTSTSSSREHSVVFCRHRDGVLAPGGTPSPPVCSTEE